MGITFAVCENCGQVNRIDVASNKKAICGSCKSDLPVDGFELKGSDKSLARLIQKSPLPVIIDVWASWCGPCRAFAPTFKTVSKEFSGKAVFVKLNSEENQKLPAEWGIRGIPALLVFKSGREADRISGALPIEEFRRWVGQQVS